MAAPPQAGGHTTGSETFSPNIPVLSNYVVSTASSTPGAAASAPADGYGDILAHAKVANWGKTDADEHVATFGTVGASSAARQIAIATAILKSGFAASATNAAGALFGDAFAPDGAFAEDAWVDFGPERTDDGPTDVAAKLDSLVANHAAGAGPVTFLKSDGYNFTVDQFVRIGIISNTDAVFVAKYRREQCVDSTATPPRMRAKTPFGLFFRAPLSAGASDGASLAVAEEIIGHPMWTSDLIMSQVTPEVVLPFVQAYFVAQRYGDASAVVDNFFYGAVVRVRTPSMSSGSVMYAVPAAAIKAAAPTANVAETTSPYVAIVADASVNPAPPALFTLAAPGLATPLPAASGALLLPGAAKTGGGGLGTAGIVGLAFAAVALIVVAVAAVVAIWMATRRRRQKKAAAASVGSGGGDPWDNGGYHGENS